MKAKTNIEVTHPFLTYIDLGKEVVVGIVLNSNKTQVKIYDYNLVKAQDDKKRLLEVGERWWFGTDASRPIGMVYGDEMDEYARYIRTVSTKEIVSVRGPMVDLSEQISQRSKRRRVRVPRKVAQKG